MGFFDQFIETTNRLSPVQTFQSARNFRMIQQQQEAELGIALRKQALDEQTAALGQQVTQFNLNKAQRAEQTAREMTNLAESIFKKTETLATKPVGALVTKQVSKGKKVGTAGQLRRDIGQQLSTSIGLTADIARFKALKTPEVAIPEDLTPSEKLAQEKLKVFRGLTVPEREVAAFPSLRVPSERDTQFERVLTKFKDLSKVVSERESKGEKLQVSELNKLDIEKGQLRAVKTFLGLTPKAKELDALQQTKLKLFLNSDAVTIDRKIKEVNEALEFLGIGQGIDQRSEARKQEILSQDFAEPTLIQGQSFVRDDVWTPEVFDAYVAQLGLNTGQ